MLVLRRNLAAILQRLDELNPDETFCGRNDRGLGAGAKRKPGAGTRVPIAAMNDAEAALEVYRAT